MRVLLRARQTRRGLRCDGAVRNLLCTIRVRWDASELVVVDSTGGSSRSTNADGSIVAVASNAWQCPCIPTLAVWHEHSPVLTTYGYGTTGTTLTWDIGGNPGDPFVLGLVPPRAGLFGMAAAHGLGEIPPGQLLGLELGAGIIAGPHNVGTIEQVLPPLGGHVGAMDIDVAFRATVFDASGQDAPQTTNTTRFTLTLTAEAQLSSAGDAGGVSVGSPRSWPHPELQTLSLEEAFWRYALVDPKLQRMALQGELLTIGEARADGSPGR